MNKLQLYNQRLLAIIGTLALVGLAGLLLTGAIALLIDIFSSNHRTSRNQGIVIDQNQMIDTSSFSFTQEISILQPFQLDSTKPVFIIPIGQKDQTSKRFSVAAAGLSFDSESSDDYRYSSFTGLYNNFVLLDYTRDLRKPIFDTKIAITEWAYMKIDSNQLILFKGTNDDINADGILNENDFQSLFVFNIATLKMKKLQFENQTVRDFEPLSKTSKIYVRTGKDSNNDKEFDNYKEPTDLYFYDATTGESETLVPDIIKKEIQQILSN